ncbi:hypothetical protein AB0O51_13730 [Streptomyces sp. NPDC090301]|uniref:hypothetical protein n=1 Tax=Streptomyces sp. NPDC090301 TaxID=3154975 RepID=UPI003434AC62
MERLNSGVLAIEPAYGASRLLATRIDDLHRFTGRKIGAIVVRNVDKKPEKPDQANRPEEAQEEQ